MAAFNAGTYGWVLRRFRAPKVSFASLFDGVAAVDAKAKFGNLRSFVNGNMCAGRIEGTVGEAQEQSGWDEAAAVDVTGPFGPRVRPMGGDLALPGQGEHPEGTTGRPDDRQLGL